ncbi:pre-peptidase C-terminal domain-containing protein [Streptomyces sp. NPDC021224]|uniref:pre-peptidase C-terminal domain-containing protein n=1 Tax=unclassified Streptomyces TaxID=2593676 RepID=UPI00378EB6B2
MTTLPTDGTYTVLFDPDGDLTGSMTATVSTLVTAVATVGGPAVTLTTTAPGQTGTWTFTGTTGQRVYLDLSNGTFDDYDATVSVLKPNGTVLLDEQYCGVSCGFDTTTLPTDGTYTVILRPDSTTYGSLTLRIYQVPADATTTIATNGTPSTLTAGTPGQNARWTFTGTTGQKISFSMSNGTFDDYGAEISVLKPNGKDLVAPRYCEESCTIAATKLPTDGTYTILLHPIGTATGSLTATAKLTS